MNSDDSRLDGGKWQTGLNVGVVAGISLTDQQPLYLETGLSYTEKGGTRLCSGSRGTRCGHLAGVHQHPEHPHHQPSLSRIYPKTRESRQHDDRPAEGRAKQPTWTL